MAIPLSTAFKGCESIFLDTSFILNAFWSSNSDFIRPDVRDRNLWSLENILSERKVSISIGVMVEIINVLERKGLENYINEEAAKIRGYSREAWRNLEEDERESFRKNIGIIAPKDWRNQSKYKPYYTVYTENEIKNIKRDLESLPEFSYIDTSPLSAKDCGDGILSIKQQFPALDAYDSWHYITAKHNNINCILTCDKDFDSIDGEGIKVINTYNRCFLCS